MLAATHLGDNYRPLAEVLDEKSIVNGIIGLLATGGSTNHTMHLVAIAAAAGIKIDWQDFADLSAIVPQLAHVYPNGSADVNHFHAAGGLGFIIRDMLDTGCCTKTSTPFSVTGCAGSARSRISMAANSTGATSPDESLDTDILRPCSDPFHTEGGLRLVSGNLGRAIVKVSAVDPKYHAITAPARVFDCQQAFVDAFNNDELERDFVAVVRRQGPRANGMPELHKLTPYLGLLQNRGHRVALLTDGRMSGASGKVLAAIQVTPEAVAGGAIAKIRDGDLITIDASNGVVAVTSDADFEQRADTVSKVAGQTGTGRELFSAFREHATGAEHGASLFGDRR